MIKLYVYRKSDGLYMYEDVGNPNMIVHDLQNDKDFTLTPPPDNDHQWLWQFDKWVQAAN